MTRSSALARRLQAAELFARGWSQARVAQELGVTRTTAMRWHRAFCRDGRGGLARRGRRGRPRKLTARALSQVLQPLPRSWSVDRLALEVERRTGVRYHPGHLWRVLSAWGWWRSRELPPAVAWCDPDGNPLLLIAASGAADQAGS